MRAGVSASGGNGQAYSRGRSFWGRFARPWVEKAAHCFQEAAALDPAYASSHAGLADCFLVAGLSGALPPALAWSLAHGATSAARERDPWVVALPVDPALAPLRQEPRFAALVERVHPTAPLDPALGSGS